MANAIHLPLRDESVQCCVTSPPYWGLRDYGVGGQLGLEATPDEYIAKMVQVFREVRRVLREDGTCWVNMGDSYASNGGHSDENCNDRRGQYNIGNRPEHENRTFRARGGTDCDPKRGSAAAGQPKKFCVNLKPKDLCGIPWRLAFALQADGWWLRSDIIWAKPNPMPESVTDRPTKSHEYIFLLTKSERYFYDAEAIKEEASENTHDRRPKSWDVDLGSNRTLMQGYARQIAMPDNYHGSVPGRKDGPGQDRRSTNDRGRKLAEPGSGVKNNSSFDEAMAVMPASRNKRTVWTIATQPFPEAHFATFPEKLVEPCILAGTSEKGCCPKCAAPWERVTESETHFESGSGKAGNPPNGKHGTEYEQALSGDYDIRMGPVKETRTVGWQPTCSCGVPETDPCTVLDPFAGSGTTGVICRRYFRKFIGVELNPEYIAIAKRRLSSESPLFHGVYD